MEKIFLLKNLTCANCSAKIEAKIQAMEGIDSAQFTLATQQLRVTTGIEDDERLIRDFQAICDVIEEGVNVEKYERLARGEALEGEESLTALDRLALLFGILAVIYEITIQFMPDLSLPHLVEMVVFILIYLLVAHEVLLTAGRNILKGQVFDENFLMAIATVGALLIGEYPEAVGVMVFYRIGELFEEHATRRSRNEIMGAVDMRPQEVRLLSPAGGVTVVAPEEVQVGDIIEVRPGDSIPLDGTVVEGETRVNTSPVTGEPVPVAAKPGTELLSGYINESGRITLRVDKLLHDSMVTKILDAVEHAAASKPKIDRFITRFARIYTPIVVILALLIAIIPSLITGAWGQWVYTALTFLVISCPCALVLSVPLAFFSGIGNASRKGIILKGGVVIEALSGIKALALDKTGTITNGVFAVQAVHPVDGLSNTELLTMAASLERASNHPIAMSIVAESVAMSLPLVEVQDLQEIAGQGLVGNLQGVQILVGNRRLMEAYHISNFPAVSADFGTEVLVACDGQYKGSLIISDALRSDSIDAVQTIKNRGIKTVMLTGDSQASADYVASQVGVDSVQAHLLPQDKLSAVQSLRQTYGATMFVGDGINDAPVLAGADVGGAMGSGADAAIEAADVVFMRSSLGAIAYVLDLSKSTVRIAWQNVVFAIAVKVGIMILGLLGYANMWAAVFADTGVAILCILNSIRILYRR